MLGNARAELNKNDSSQPTAEDEGRASATSSFRGGLMVSALDSGAGGPGF